MHEKVPSLQEYYNCWKWVCFNIMHSLCFTELENITLLDDNTDKNTSREFMQKIACPDQINMKHISHSGQIASHGWLDPAPEMGMPQPMNLLTRWTSPLDENYFVICVWFLGNIYSGLLFLFSLYLFQDPNTAKATLCKSSLLQHSTHTIERNVKTGRKS